MQNQSRGNFDNIESDDLLSTHAFIPNPDTRDLTHFQKQNFRNYYSSKDKPQKNEFLRKTVNNVVDKNINNIIKTEKETIISIDTKDRDRDAYPNPNTVSMPFGKSFYNVKKIKLVSTEFPNTDQVIRDIPIEIRNNTVSWENEEDFDLGIYENISLYTEIPDTIDVFVEDFNFMSQLPIENYFITIYECTVPDINGKRKATIINNNVVRFPYKGGLQFPAIAKIDFGVPNYTVDLTPGNYSARTLTDEIEKKMNLVKRRNGRVDLFHFFTVGIDINTDIITFSSYITRQLPSDPLETTVASGDIQVNLLSHGFKVGDDVLVTGAKNIAGIEANTLNGLFKVKIVVNLDVFVYEVNDRANEARVGGGFTVKIGRPSNFRLLYLTGKSLIVDNIGFPEEDSSTSIGQTDPIKTRILKISNAVNIGNYIRFTTTEPHELKSSIIREIISIGLDGEVTTATPHLLEEDTITNVEICDTDTVPVIKGVFSIVSTGNTTFKLNNVNISQAGTFGYVKHSGDRINLYNFKTSPKLISDGFSVENTPNPNEFEIRANVSFIDQESISKTIIGIGQLIITHPHHGFNEIISIENGSQNGRLLITTKTNHGLFGMKYVDVVIESISGSIVDIFIPGHPFQTSDRIRITSPNLNGTFFLERIDDDTIRIDSFSANIPSSLGDIHFGDVTTFNGTNCIPSLTFDINRRPEFQVITQGFPLNQFEIEAGFQVSVPGTKGIVGRQNKICLSRVVSKEPQSPFFGGIPLNVINKRYYKISEIISEDKYLIRLFQNFSTESIQSGGKDVMVSSQRHGKKVFQSNTFSGEKNGILFRSISLEGENYVMLTSPNLDTVYSAGSRLQEDVFAKILLAEPPGVMMFNTFVSAPKEFNPPLASIDHIFFQVKRQDGFLYNFNNTDFSMSLSIIESIDRIRDSYISSQTGASELYESSH